MRIFNDQEHKESSDKEVNECRDNFTIQDSPIRKFFDMIYLESFQDGLEDKRSNKVFNESFDKGTHLGSNKESYRDTQNIILWKESHKIFEHSKS